MLKKSLISLSTLFLISLSLSVQARPVTIEFTARVDLVDDAGDALQGEVTVGQTISGSYSFDTDLVDTDPNPESAHFSYPASASADVGFDISLGNLTYTQTANTSSEFNLHIYDGISSDGFAAVTCCGNAGTLSNGVNVSDLFVDSYSPTDNVISTATLDAAVAALNNFSDNKFNLYGTGLNGNWYSINATITSISEKGSSCEAPIINDGTLGFKARVVNIYEGNPAHPAPLKIGDMISGAYDFDPALPDMDSSPEHGRYEHPAGEPAGGVSFNISGATISSDPLSAMLNIFIDSFPSNVGPDHFHIMSMSSGIHLPDGSVIHEVGLDLHDPSGTVINSAALPDGVPTSITGFQYRDLYIYGMKSDGSYFHVNAVLEEITNSLPADQPASPAHASPASGPLVIYQHFDAGIVIDNGYEPIAFIDATITDAHGGNFHVSCHRGPMSPDGRQTVICPDVTRHLTPGNNSFSATIHFVNGNQISTITNWEVVGH